MKSFKLSPVTRVKTKKSKPALALLNWTIVPDWDIFGRCALMRPAGSLLGLSGAFSEAA